MSKDNYTYTIGRRKTSSATVRLYNKTGASTINGKKIEEVYTQATQILSLNMPFVAADLKADEFMFTSVAKGGGFNSQLEAVRLGLARAIAKIYPEKKKALKLAGLLTRDSRMVERKKPGLRKARKAEQYSKR